MPRLEALATATPDHRVDQSRLRGVAEQVLADREPGLADMLDVFESTGIEQRALARDLDWYLSSPGWPERSRAFEEEGVELAERVTRACLDEAGLPASSLDGVVFVTTTGIATPSLETHLANRLELAEEVLRVPVWGLGCAGGVAGLARASDLAKARPEGRFLLVSLELCSLAFLEGELSKKMVVAAALFSDGVAAAIVGGDDLDASGPRIQASASHLWPETRDVMGWEVEEEGLGVVFSPRIPEIVEGRMADVVVPFLKRHGTSLQECRTVFHPGGPKVLAAYEAALDLGETELEASREVLRRHGNMSSPTVLFTLEESLEGSPLASGENALMAAVGPGFAAELALVTGA